jgi:hypothetical protein
MMGNLRFLFLISTISVVACQQDGITSTQSGTGSATLTCEDYATRVTGQGVLLNNVWNRQAAGNDAWSQCLVKREVEGVVQYGWSWNWPAGRHTVYAYPQIKIGISPWSPEPRADARFPVQISSLEGLRVLYDLELASNGRLNLATSMWLTRMPHRAAEPDPSVIAAEVMIWSHAAGFNPAGGKHGEIEAGGMVWEVWLDKGWGDISGAHDNTWIYITFKAQGSFLQADIDVLPLLKYAVSEGLIGSDLYIADVELGNEIMSGSGTAWVKTFRVITGAAD